MNNEIKKILERIKNWCDLALDDNCNTIMYKYEFVAILDYITNLQEKVEQYENPDDLTLFYMWLDEKAKDKMKKLQEENKELKAKLEMYENGVYFSSENDELQQRIERLQNILDNIGYQIEGIIRKTDDIEINKATGEILAKHNIELLKEILKMIVNKDVSIMSDKNE